MKKTKREQWLTVERCSAYSVSTLGRVRRDKAGRGARAGHILSPRLTVLAGGRPGYYFVSLWENNEETKAYIHDLVAAAFIGDKPAGVQVNHEDGIKTNNRLTNLEYTTPKGNSQHAVRLGLASLPCFRGVEHGMAKLTDNKVRQIRKLRSSGQTQDAIAAQFGVSQASISSVLLGKTWAHVK